MLGQFLELALSTPDIAASLAFYERLGFSQLPCTDSWRHAYCVVSDGRLCLGLHQRDAAPHSLTLVRPDLAAHEAQLLASGAQVLESHLGFEDFHRLQLRVAGGQELTVLEARTFSPPGRAVARSRCGYWSAWSMPASDLALASAAWERLGCIAHAAEELPFAHVSITADRMNLALHEPATLQAAALVFTAEAQAATVDWLQARGLETRRGLPAGLDPACNGLLVAPEGTRLLLLQGDY